jgi:hypothetical protein
MEAQRKYAMAAPEGRMEIFPCHDAASEAYREIRVMSKWASVEAESISLTHNKTVPCLSGYSKVSVSLFLEDIRVCRQWNV